jgi:hypothetical protein
MRRLIVHQMAPLIISLFGAQAAVGQTWLEREAIGEISEQSAKTLVGRWTLHNCDMEARLVPAERLCGQGCPASFHMFLYDRVRGNTAIITLTVRNSGDASAAPLGIGGSLTLADPYSRSAKKISFFSRGIRGWSRGTKDIRVSSDFLRIYQPRWHVWCSRG